MVCAAQNLRVLEVPVRPVYADEKSGLRPWHVLLIMGVIYRRWRQLRTASLAENGHVALLPNR
jgi:hypothetical protein